MEKYTIPQIVEQRICIAPMSKEQFEIFKKESIKILPDCRNLGYRSDLFYRIYKDLDKDGDLVGWHWEDYYNHEEDGIKASKTIQFSQIDFEENKVENPNDLIGKMCKGFRFDSENNRIEYSDRMDLWIGKTGEITQYNNYSKSYSVSFTETEWWDYPAELIHLHLVEEETPILCKNCSHPIKSDRKPYLKTELNEFCDSACFDEYKENEEYKGETIADICERIKNKEPEELDLTKILIEGETYYSTIFGSIKCIQINKSLIEFKTSDDREEDYYPNGKYLDYEDCEKTLFPSKEIRTWENYSPFKKGEVCLFWNEGQEKTIGFYFNKENKKYFSGTLNKGILEMNVPFSNCERYDPSKFNF